MEPTTKANVLAAMRRTRELAKQLLDGLDEEIAENIAAAAPGSERAYVRRLSEQTLKIAKRLQKELGF